MSNWDVIIWILYAKYFLTCDLSHTLCNIKQIEYSVFHELANWKCQKNFVKKSSEDRYSKWNYRGSGVTLFQTYTCEVEVYMDITENVMISQEITFKPKAVWSCWSLQLLFNSTKAQPALNMVTLLSLAHPLSPRTMGSGTAGGSWCLVLPKVNVENRLFASCWFFYIWRLLSLSPQLFLFLNWMLLILSINFCTMIIFLDIFMFWSFFLLLFSFIFLWL